MLRAEPADILKEGVAEGKERYDLVLDFDTISDIGKGGFVLELTEEKQAEVIAYVKQHNSIAPDLLWYDLIKSEDEEDEGGAGGAKERPDAEQLQFTILDSAVVDSVGELIMRTKNNKLVAVLGLFNRGKTHFLDKVAYTDLPSGKRVSTKGLSFKNPSHIVAANYLLGDTAGQNSPLEVKDIEQADISGEHIGELSQSELHDMRLKKAMVNKKAKELFLQETIFNMSDVLVIVVNEMTWPDQQYIVAISQKIIEDRIRIAVERHRVSQKFNRIIVIHNFKDTKTEEQFRDLQEKYVKQCYHGQVVKYPVTRPNHPEPFMVEYWATTKDDSVHFFLADEAGVAGEKWNAPTYEAIRHFINVTGVPNKPSITRILCDETFMGLSSFFQHLEAVNLCLRSDGQLVLKAVGNLKLVREEIVYDGSYMSLARPEKYGPLVDAIQTHEAYIVIMDLAGFPHKGQKNSPTKIYDQCQCTYNLRVFPDKNEIAISGKRALYYRLCSPPTTDDTSKRCWTDLCKVYASDDTPPGGFLDRRERKFGEFSRSIKIPNEYNIRDFTDYYLGDGQLQIVFRRHSPIDNDSI